MDDASRPFAGRYELRGRLGSGGFGTVYRAWDTHLRIEVALKVTNAAIADPGLIQRFEREAHVIARLSHENIVKIYDFGVADGTPFYTMECIAGDSLQKVMDVNRVLAPRAAARITRDTALALHHAHINGVVHRDVKPHNILVQPREETGATRKGDASESVRSTQGVISQFRVVLTDFGLAKDEGAQTKLSVTGEVMGTPHYMAPEQAMGERASVGPATDVYSLGVTLYYLLSGKLPYEGTTFPEIVANIMTTEPRPLKRAAPHLPAELCALVQKAIEKEVALRYKSALAFAEDCENFLKGEPVNAKPPPLAVKARRFVRRNVALCASVATAVLVAGAALAYTGIVVPYRVSSQERRAFEAKRAAFMAEKSRVESEAAAGLRDAEQALGRREFDGAVRGAQQLIETYSPYSRAVTFPRKSFAWNEAFEAAVPFRVPIVQAMLVVAGAHESRQEIAEATRHHLRAYFTWSEAGQPGDPDALFALAHFFLRTRRFEDAARHFKASIDRGAPPSAEWSAYCLGFALSGAGKYDAAARAFESARPPPDLPLHPADGELVPLYSLPPTAEVIAEAAQLCRMFGGRRVMTESVTAPVCVADLDGDGRDEIVCGTALGAEIVTPGGRRHVEGAALAGHPVETGDVDGDGRPELFVTVQGGFRVFKVTSTRLELMHERVGENGGTLRVHSVTPADLDGDGRPEILMHAHQEFRLYRNDGREWICVLSHRIPSTDVAAFVVKDLDADGRKELLVVTGTWGAAGFKAWVYPGAEAARGGNPQPSVTPIGRIASGLLETPEAFLFTTCAWAMDLRTQDFIYGELGLDRFQGLCKISHAGGRLGAPELVWGRRVASFEESSASLLPIVAKGGTHALVHLHGDRERRVIRVDRRPWSYLPLDALNAPGFTPCDLDGDGDRELVEWRDGRLFVCGLPGGGPVTVEPQGPTGDPPSSRAAAFQDAMLGLSVFLERDEQEAAIAYLEHDMMTRFPEFEKELRTRVADCRQRLLQWDRALETLRRIRTTFHLPPAELQELDRRMLWVGEMTALRETAALEFSAEEKATLLTNAPFKFRLDAGVLRVFGNSVGPAFLAVPVESDERSHIVSARFKLHRLDYTTGFSFGMSDGTGRDARDPFQDWTRTFTLHAGGAGGRQSATALLRATGRSGTGSMAMRPNPPLLKPSADWMELSVQTVRDAGEMAARLDRANQPVTEMRSNVPFLNPPQSAYLVVSAGGGGMAGDAMWGEMELDRIAIRSAGGATLRPWRALTPIDRFLRGGGRYVQGDFAGAAADYADVLLAVAEKRIERADAWEWDVADLARQAGFTLAFAEHRLGRTQAAEARLLGLFELDFAGTLVLFKRNHLGMAEPDRAFYRGTFWTAMERAGREATMKLLGEVVGWGPLGGMPVIETLLFTDPPDVEAVKPLLAALARRPGSPTFVAGLFRLTARLLKLEGRAGEAMRALKQADEMLDDPHVDEFERYPLKREVEALRRSLRTD